MWLALAFPMDDVMRLDARAVLDILLIAAVIYYFLNLLRGTRAAQMAVALGLIAVAYYTARWARLEMVEWLLTTLKGLGMKEDEAIESNLVSRRIKAAQQRVVASCHSDFPADSADEWLARNSVGVKRS